MLRPEMLFGDAAAVKHFRSRVSEFLCQITINAVITCSELVNKTVAPERDVTLGLRAGIARKCNSSTVCCRHAPNNSKWQGNSEHSVPHKC